MNIEIEKYQVHVWQANMNTSSFYPKDISNTLSPDELERANKFKFQKDREHFILRHYHAAFDSKQILRLPAPGAKFQIQLL